MDFVLKPSWELKPIFYIQHWVMQNSKFVELEQKSYYKPAAQL